MRSLSMKEKTHSRITRRDFLSKTIAAGAIFSSGVFARDSFAAAARPRTKARPNIVFVFADQMRSQILSCYGNKEVPTPTFDALADEGVRFTNAISTYPVCSP